MDLLTLAEGPLLWISLGVFVVGLGARVVLFLAESREKDKIFWQHFQWKWVIGTMFKWLIPANRTVAKDPVFSILAYVFHICLLAVPIWYLPHIIYWQNSRFDVSYMALPDGLADWMTLAMLAISVYLLVRRMVSPDLRYLSTASDYVLLVITALPFLTGYLSAHQTLGVGNALGDNMQLIHILSGELMLVVVPFTKLSHAVLFFLSRAATAVEFGRREYTV
jgi:nitrate reductase gamma subunit